MPLISIYQTNPPVAPPATILADDGDLPDGQGGFAPFVIDTESVDGIDVEVKLSAGSATYRPYYWRRVPGATNNGAWVPIGGDATSGAGPVTVDVTKFGGAANGRYQHRGGKRQIILVREDGTDDVVEWAAIEPRRVVCDA